MKPDVVTAITQAVDQAASVERAVEQIALILREDYDLWRVSMLRFTPNASVIVVATWNLVSTSFAPGTEISVNLTPTIAELSFTLLRGEAAAFTAAAIDLGMIGDVISEEGDRSIAAVPLSDDRTVVAVLVFGSGRDAAFTQADLQALLDIAGNVQARLLELAS
jgi:hypothetical protein